ncbi:MAG: hypothetical protein V2G42_05720 [bacterium JZ-2024 1]
MDIRQDYSKDPAFFGKSFWDMFETALKARRISDEGTHIITLSLNKPEDLIVMKGNIRGGNYGSALVFIDCEKTAIQGENAFVSNKEVVSSGDLIINVPTKVRALLVRGDLKVAKPTVVTRWVHVEGNCLILSSSDLGINLYCGGILSFQAPSTFGRLFAKEIVMGEGTSETAFATNPAYVKGTLRSRGSVSIKTQDRKVVIEGTIISDEDIQVEGDVWIKGNVFSHRGIVLLKGCLVGEKNKIKSIVAKKSVRLVGNLKVYGYIHTDGEGIIEP